MNYGNLLCIGVFAYLMQICLVDGHSSNGLRSIQRRFMWKQMDNTVDGLMDGMASSARAMKNMFGELMNPVTAPTYKMGSPFDFLPSETTRIKYIIRSPTSGKPMKTIKIQTPKKLIRIVTVPKAIVQGKFPKSKFKFPSTEELRKIEKEQERMVEGRTPQKSNDELLAEIEAQKHVSEPEQHEDYEDYQPQKEGDNNANGSNENNDIISGYIPEFGNQWKPVQIGDVSKKPEPFSTIKPFPMSKLHTSIISGESTTGVVEKPVLIQPPTSVDDYEDFEDAQQPGHTYEVTEETAEESISVPLTQRFHAARGHRAQSTSSTTTTSTTASPTTEEEPNYPAAFLRKYRERTAASTQTSTRFRPSETMLDTSWIPTTRNNTSYKYAVSSSHLTKPQPPKSTHYTRTKSEKWPPPKPAAAPQAFGAPTVVVHHAVAESLRSSKIETTQAPEAVTAAQPVMRPPRKNTQLQTLSPKGIESQTRNTRQRGRIRYGDKLNPDDFE